MDIFNWFGSLLGYLLWFLYEIVNNYGVAIILFTIIVKGLLFPFSIKQQKSMASQAKVQKKVRELQKIYANDKMKLSEETQKLYQKEGVSMSGGCLTMLIPFPILFGIYYSVLYPLRNALHTGADRVNAATQLLSQIPVFSFGLPAILSLYFDFFSSVLQACIFCMLTMMYVGGAASTGE